MTWKVAHAWWGSNPRSLDYIPSSINSRHVSDYQSNASQIYFNVSGDPNEEILCENDKNMNCRCSMTAILHFTNCGKTVSFTDRHTAEWNSAQNHIGKTSEVPFLKNAYRSLSRTIFQFLSWLLMPAIKFCWCARPVSQNMRRRTKKTTLISTCC